MFGFRDRFTYFECNHCGCVQIEDIPTDLSKYYPEGYYSLSVAKENAFKRFLKRRRAAQALNKNTFGGKLLIRIWGTPPLVKWLRPTGVSLDDAILDVGSGAGQLLLDMSNIGFSNLIGIDPYVEHDLFYDGNVRVLKKELYEIQGTYDLITFHHSFEHMPDPRSTLIEVGRLLPTGKNTLIRIPVAGTYAWRTYGTDWVQLDAPRHLFLHTDKSIAILAKQAGFVVDNVIYDSTGFQIWGSEQYRQDIPLRDKRSYSFNPKHSIFSTEEIERFEAHARQLNATREGDQACFYLRRIREGI